MGVGHQANLSQKGGGGPVEGLALDLTLVHLEDRGTADGEVLAGRGVRPHGPGVRAGLNPLGTYPVASDDEGLDLQLELGESSENACGPGLDLRYPAMHILLTHILNYTVIRKEATLSASPESRAAT